MSAGRRALPDRLCDGLVAAGTWMSREQLFGLGETASPLVLEDALADLVVEGRVEYQEGAGYRMVGTPLARRAARDLRRRGTGVKRLFLMQRDSDAIRIGVAEQRASVGSVMYELALPLTSDPLEQELAVLDFATRGGFDVQEA